MHKGSPNWWLRDSRQAAVGQSFNVFRHNLERIRVGRHGFQKDVERGMAFEELQPPRELSPGLVAWSVGIRDDTMLFAEA